MKKIITLALSSLLFLTLLTGCGQKNETPEDDGNTLHFFSYVLTDEQTAAYEEIFADFEEETGIHVEASYQGTWSEAPELLNSMKLSGTPVDIFIQGVGLIQSPLGPGAMIKDLTNIVDEEVLNRYEDGVLDSCYMGDHLWCLPMADGGAWTIMYNKTMFEELGLEVPTTFDELTEAAATINEELGITPMMINGKDTWAWPGLYMSTYAEATDGQSVENVEAFLNGDKTFDGEAEIQAFEWIADLFDAGIMKADSLDTDTTGLVASFVQERVAMIFTLDSTLSDIRNASPDFEYGVLPYPIMDGASDYYYGYGIGDGSLCIPAFIDDANLEKAALFIEFATRPENAEKVLNAGGATKFKIMKEVDNSDDAFVQEMNEVVTPHAVTYLDWIWPAQINDAFCQAIPALASGTITSEEAVTMVQNAYDTIVRENDYIYAWWDNFTEEEAQMVYPAE